MLDELPGTSEYNIQLLTNFQSDDLLEKLKLLDYEKLLLKEVKMKALSRFYFVSSTNPGEQFYMFTLICWWLSQKLGKEMKKPQEFDDPHIVINNVLQILEKMDIPVNFQANKLIHGAGPYCLFVLDSLVTQVLKLTKISCQHHHIAQEDESATEYLEDNAEIILEKLEDQQIGTNSDESDTELDGGGVFLKNINWISHRNRNVEINDEDTRTADIFTEQHHWRLELERVLPHLKVFVKADVRDWRSHLSQIETLKSSIDEISEETQLYLKKLHNEFTYSLEKVESREKHLNMELQQLIKQFKDVSIDLSNIQHAYIKVQTDTEGILEQMNEVVTINDTKKLEMEQRGQSMSDGSTVIQIKKAINKLKDDIAQLNLEVALSIHAIDQDIIRQAGSFADSEYSVLQSATRTF